MLTVYTGQRTMQIQGLSKNARDWLKATAIHFGCSYRGRASVRLLLEKLAAGELKIIEAQKEVDNLI